MVGTIFEPPQPWKMPITGYGPSGPLAGAGGSATETSIGVPSKLGTVAAPVPQKRWPLACTVQATAPPMTLLIAASAVAGTSNPVASATETSILRISLLLLDRWRLYALRRFSMTSE